MRADTATIALDPGKRALLAFGPFLFDRENRFLSRNGVELPLPPRVVGVLALLLDRPGQLITKQDLISAVWRDAFVTETSLAEAISVLRQTLEDDPQRPTYIQTLHRRGYRFIAPVTDLPVEAQTTRRETARGELTEREQAGPARSDGQVGVQGGEATDSGPNLWLLFPWLVTFFALVIAASAVWQYLDTAAPAPRPVTRFTLTLPEGLTLSTVGAPVAVSRDGASLAFAGCKATGCAIYLRPLAQADPTPVAGTTGGAAPFFSPDGRWLGYFAGGQLRKIALAGGSPVTLAQAAAPLGATWTRDGRIVFAGSETGGLLVMPANGGTVRPLTSADAGSSHRWPDALPDGSAVVFTVAGAAHASDQQYAGIVSMRTGVWGRLLDDVSAVRVPGARFLLAQRGTDLLGVALDARALSVAGLPVAVAQGAIAPDAVPQFAMSEAGTAAIGTPGGREARIVLDWSGELRRVIPMPAPALPR